MTIDREGNVRISKWVIGIVLPLIVSLVTTLAVYAFSSGEQARQVKVNTEMIQQKVDKDVMNLVLKKLDSIEAAQIRLEDKLDDHVSK